MVKRYIVTALALAMLAACGGGNDALKTDNAETAVEAVREAANEVERVVEPSAVPAKTEQVVQVAETIQIVEESDILNAGANIDGQIIDFAPALAERLEAKVTAEIEEAKADAKANSSEGFFNAHDYQADYVKVAAVDDIISIESQTMRFAGGAHPNFWIGGIIHDRASGEDIPASALLSADGEGAMKVFLKDALAIQKLKRLSLTEADLPAAKKEVDEIFPAEIGDWFKQVTLLPSTQEGKFGGLMVHYSPYDVGAYAEGSYDILVKASELKTMLDSSFLPMFGGEPDIDIVDQP